MRKKIQQVKTCRVAFHPRSKARNTALRACSSGAFTLPLSFGKLIVATEEPFVQAILDLAIPQMSFERVALVGDAAFIPRPHTAASTSKAAANAIALADALITHNHNVPKALEAWEPAQLAYGIHLLKHGQMLGDRSQFSYGSGRFGEVMIP